MKQAASQLSERKARCDREHQAIVEEIEAVQSELRTSTERQMQGQEVQAARMDAMGYRMAEMKDMMAQREVRMEAQIQEVCSQTQAMGTALKNVQPQSTLPNNTIKELLQETDMTTKACEECFTQTKREYNHHNETLGFQTTYGEIRTPTSTPCFEWRSCIKVHEAYPSSTNGVYPANNEVSRKGTNV